MDFNQVSFETFVHRYNILSLLCLVETALPVKDKIYMRPFYLLRTFSTKFFSERPFTEKSFYPQIQKCSTYQSFTFPKWHSFKIGTLLWPPICRNKPAITPKWFNSLDTNSNFYPFIFDLWLGHVTWYAVKPISHTKSELKKDLT